MAPERKRTNMRLQAAPTVQSGFTYRNSCVLRPSLAHFQRLPATSSTLAEESLQEVLKKGVDHGI